MQSQNWMPVVGYEGLYEINISGIVRSQHNKNPGKLLVSRVDRAGYITVRLSVKGKTLTRFIHRLLAEAFIANPSGKPHVNHINGIKTDNVISNLEWVTHAENIKHAYTKGLIPVSFGKCKRIVDDCTGKIFDSIKEAAAYCNVTYSTCKNMLRGIRKNTTCLKYAA